jgi:hypothetical protein
MDRGRDLKNLIETRIVHVGVRGFANYEDARYTLTVPGKLRSLAMLPWVALTALVVALPGSINACVSLYDRFLANRERKPVPTGQTGGLGLWVFNLISLALLGTVVVGTWILPPRAAPVQPPAVPSTATAPASSNASTNELQRLKYEANVRLGRVSWSNIHNRLIEPPDTIKQQPPKYFVIISHTPDNAVVGNDLQSLLITTFLQTKLGLPNLPDYSRDLDAPKFNGKGDPGITIHGRNPAADFLDTILQNCYFTHRTTEMPEGIAEYYHHLSPTTMSLTDVFTWLEIGNGLPWRPQYICHDVPGN